MMIRDRTCYVARRGARWPAVSAPHTALPDGRVMRPHHKHCGFTAGEHTRHAPAPRASGSATSTRHVHVSQTAGSGRANFAPRGGDLRDSDVTPSICVTSVTVRAT
eukprot:1230683-Prymnesium_polylepis.2